MFADLTPLRLSWLTLALIGAGVSLGLGPAATDAPRPDHWVAALTLVLWCGVETTVRRNWPALLALPALALQELPLLQQDVVGIEALDAFAGLLASTGGPV